MSDFSNQTIHDMNQSIESLIEIIKKLEERIVALELKLDRSLDPNPPDGWYFDY